MFSNTWTLSDNISIFFTDSGPPPSSSDYTTIIFLHGSNFNGRSFEHLHELAHPRNLRTVILTRRDYAGSSPLTDSEMDDLKDGRQEFLDGIGGQLAEFIAQFIAKENIPKVSEDRKSGGIAILGWSFGTITGMSLFSSPSHSSSLEEYIKDLVLYDPTYSSMGYPTPEYSNTFNPVSNPSLAAQIASLSPEESFKFFCAFVASYYDHPNLSLESDKAGDFDTRLGTERVTTEKWTKEEVEKWYETFALRSEHLLFSPAMQQMLNTLTTRVLFSPATSLPDLRITYIGCTQSNWGTVWCTLETQRLYKRCLQEGKKIREIRFVMMDGCNHFVYYDNPTDFMTKVAESLRS